MVSKVTIREVAREAGVSIQTVSNVLNRRHGVALETRHRVREVAQSLGYRPSAAARSLRSGRSRTIGLLLSNVANPYFGEVARGAEDAAHARGYSLILGSTDNQLDRIRELLNVFREHRVAGVIASAGSVESDALNVFEEFAEGAPVVQLGRPTPSPSLPRMLADDCRGGFVATSHLLSLGRRRVATITGPLDSYPGSQRLAGYREALAQWGHPDDPSLVVEGQFTYQSGDDAMGTLLEHTAPPDGIFAGNDLTAIGAITRLRQAGLRVPEDVAIIGYDDAEVGRFYDPPLSTIAQPKYEFGYRAVELLLEQVEAMERDPEAGRPAPRAELLDCELILRYSSLGRKEEINRGSIFGEAPWRLTGY